VIDNNLKGMGIGKWFLSQLGLYFANAGYSYIYSLSSSPVHFNIITKMGAEQIKLLDYENNGKKLQINFSLRKISKDGDRQSAIKI
jgi:hypothetical protein